MGAGMGPWDSGALDSGLTYLTVAAEEPGDPQLWTCVVQAHCVSLKDEDWVAGARRPVQLVGPFFPTWTVATLAVSCFHQESP